MDMTADIETQIKDADEILADYVSRMKPKLTKEDNLLCCMAGIGTTKIADLLGIQASTVWRHRHIIQMKYCKYINPDMECWI